MYNSNQCKLLTFCMPEIVHVLNRGMCGSMLPRKQALILFESPLRHTYVILSLM